MDPFADIRPYHDQEVPQVISRLLADPELIDAITRLKFKHLPSMMRLLLRPLVRRALHRELAGVQDVASLQALVAAYMSRMINDSTAGLSVSGLEHLQTHQPYLYISNHRDIVLDPAFTNYALFHHRRETVRIAIGDNLLTKPYVADLMRLNKSFIVNRSATAPRQVLQAYRNLSTYIRHSIFEDRAPVWIAQREGRAKDGIDRTEPAIIKMLAMSKGRGLGFGEYIAALYIVPVAISYELDPCDGLKASELYQAALQGSYQKAEHEDIDSIATGITGAKGGVHVAFGKPLGADLDNPAAVAQELDRQIINNYALHGTNIYAYRSLHGAGAPLPVDYASAASSCSEEEFQSRIENLPKAHRSYALEIYANAVTSKFQYTAARK